MVTVLTRQQLQIIQSDVTEVTPTHPRLQEQLECLVKTRTEIHQQNLPAVLVVARELCQHLPFTGLPLRELADHQTSHVGSRHVDGELQTGGPAPLRAEDWRYQGAGVIQPAQGGLSVHILGYQLHINIHIIIILL